MDVFERIETTGIGFVKRNYIFLIIIGNFFVIFTTMALLLTAIAAPIGLQMAYEYTVAKGDPTEIQNWDTLIFPIASALLAYQGYLIWTIGIGWIVLCLYVIARGVYRRVNRNKGEDIKPSNNN